MARAGSAGRSALRLAREGVAIVVNYRANEAAAGAVVDEIAALGSQATAIAGDVTEADMPERLVEATLETFGRLDILVANAGVTRDMLALRMSDDDWAFVLDTNLRQRLPLLPGGAAADGQAARRPDRRRSRRSSAWRATPARPTTPPPRPVSSV